ncbi:hypothetical protein SynWH8103_00466 [Synechococcus sp. WH 8103]|nr:hypothetical protein SynWH8103_00466 [Synechococcus sp. WH 8103]
MFKAIETARNVIAIASILSQLAFSQHPRKQSKHVNKKNVEFNSEIGKPSIRRLGQ